MSTAGAAGCGWGGCQEGYSGCILSDGVEASEVNCRTEARTQG